MKNYGLILSAGSSTRFGGTIKKQFYELKGKPVLFYSINAFNKSKLIDEIVVVTSKEDIERVNQLVSKYSFYKVKCVVAGGQSRQESVECGLSKLEDGIVLIHDSARPLVDEEVISSLVDALKNNDGATPAIKSVDTIIKVKDGNLISFEDRESLYRIQTPQAFKINVIKEAHEKYKNQNATDDTQLVKSLGYKIKIVPGKEQLLKLTRLEDTNALEAYIEQNEYLQN